MTPTEVKIEIVTVGEEVLMIETGIEKVVGRDHHRGRSHKVRKEVRLTRMQVK